MNLNDQLKKAQADHEKLKEHLGNKHPGAYDKTKNAIDFTLMSKEEIGAYEQSRANRTAIEEKVDEFKKIEDKAIAAVSAHNQLKQNLGMKYPGTYDPDTNTIDANSWTDEDIDIYKESHQKRNKALDEKEEAEKKITNAAVEEKFAKNAPAALAKSPCKSKKPEVEKQKIQEHFINFKIQDQSGKPLHGITLNGILPGDEKFSITLDEKDQGILKIPNIKNGKVYITSNWRNITLNNAVFLIN